MAITITQEPDDVVLAGNSVIVKATTDKYVTNAGVKTVFYLNWNNFPTIGEYFTIGFNQGLSVTMTAVATPDDTGNQFAYTSGSVSAFVTALVTSLKANYLLNKYYEISKIGTDIVRFLAREKGEAFIADFSTDIDVADMTYDDDTDGEDRTYNENFNVLLALLVEDTFGGDVYSRALELTARPNDAEEVEFNLNTRMKAYLTTNEKPAYGLATLMVCAYLQRRFKIELSEFYGETPVSKKVYAGADYFTALNGAVKFNDAPAYANFYTDFIAVNKPFLTWNRNEREVTVEQPLYVYIYNPTTTADYYRMRVRVWYTDGTNSGYQIIHSVAAAGYHKRLLCFPLQFDLVLASIEPTKTPVSYNCYIEKEVSLVKTLISETRTFYIKDSGYHDRYFLYKNSLGVYDTLLTTGLFEESTETSANEVVVPPQGEYLEDAAQFFNDNTKFRDGATGNTGAKSDSLTLAVFKEFLNSPEVYLIDTVNERYVPIIIERQSFVMRKDDFHLYQLTFNYKEAFVNEGISNAL